MVLFFELPITGTPVPDMNSPTIQQIVQAYNVAVNMKQRSRGYSTTVTVRGAANNAAGLKEGTVRLMEHLTGSHGVRMFVHTLFHEPGLTEDYPIHLTLCSDLST